MIWRMIATRFLSISQTLIPPKVTKITKVRRIKKVNRIRMKRSLLKSMRAM